MKTGLVLEGGAMRGMFTAGVLDVMLEHGIDYDGLIGVSAGAAFGCNYKSRQPGRAIRYNTRFSRDPRYCSLRSLLKTGDLYGADFCYRELPDTLDPFDRETFDASPMAFYAVCTDMATGGPVYRRLHRADGNCMAWIRASASMPIVSRIVEVDGYRLLDGGPSDAIPLRYFESIGYGRNVVVLTQPMGYVKRRDPHLALLRSAYRAYPHFIRTMDGRYRAYNETTAYVRRREEEGAAFVIRPGEKLPIRLVERDPKRLMAVYRIGRETMEARMEDLKAFLANEKTPLRAKEDA